MIIFGTAVMRANSADGDIINKAIDIVKNMDNKRQSKIGVCLLTDLFGCSKLSEAINSKILKEGGF